MTLPLLKWTVIGVTDSMTVCDVFRELAGKLPSPNSEAVTGDELVCQVVQSDILFLLDFLFSSPSRT